MAVADMVLSGTVCEVCFVCIDNTSPGTPRKCKWCNPQQLNALKCSKCDRSFFGSDALKQHIKAKHG